MFQAQPMSQQTFVDMAGPNAIRTLLLDDSNFDRARIRRLSRQTDLTIEMDEVDSIEKMENAVRSNRYDLILIDYRLPVGDGMVALDRLQQDPRNRDAGKIMITGDAAVGTAVQAMRSGCHDFLTKEDMDANALNTAMRNAITVARQRQNMMQVEYQREIIKQGLLAALMDSDIQGNVVSLVREQLNKTPPDHPQLSNFADLTEVETFIATFSDEDEFIFH